MKYVTRTLTLGIISVSLAALTVACGTEAIEGTEGTDTLTEDTVGVDDTETDTAELPEDAIKRGDAELFGASLSTDAEFVAFDDLLSTPEAFADRIIQTEGIVRRACSKRGCWMEVRSLMDTASENVTSRFLDYGFFVPLDSRGAIVRFEGTAVVETLTPEQVQQYIAEGYDPGAVDEDGTATLIHFTSSGVEMWNRNED
jgi:hypothetical protein